jgi:pimeloyl-ACP methyl ester carboxylesterase
MRLAALFALALSLSAQAAVERTRDVVVLPGVGNLRAVISSPGGAAPKPAMLVVGWLSCDSVNADDPADGFIEFLNRVAEQSGMILMRVDKPGLGGSDGDCSATDFKTELEGYRVAWRQLAARPDVDRKQIFILGLSNGGGVAPLVPSEPAAAGFVSIGGWSRTWFEHMLDFERRRLTLKRIAAGDVSQRMKAVARFYDQYLIEKRTPEEILRKNPELAIAWEGDPKHQYGRPPQFFQQLQDLNLAAAWSEVAVPTLIVYGEQDWIMDREEQELIAASVNSRKRDLATLVVIPKMDHFFLLHDSMQASFDGRGERKFATESVQTVLRWLQRHVKR